LWNTYFADPKLEISDDRVGVFRQIEKGLLRALVLLPLGRSDFDEESLGVVPIPFLVARIEPSIDQLPVLISSAGSSRSWTPQVRGADCWRSKSLTIVDAFDWNPTGYPSYPYLEVAVRASDGGAEERWLLESVNTSIEYQG